MFQLYFLLDFDEVISSARITGGQVWRPRHCAYSRNSRDKMETLHDETERDAYATRLPRDARESTPRLRLISIRQDRDVHITTRYIFVTIPVYLLQLKELFYNKWKNFACQKQVVFRDLLLL